MSSHVFLDVEAPDEWKSNHRECKEIEIVSVVEPLVDNVEEVEESLTHHPLLI